MTEAAPAHPDEGGFTHEKPSYPTMEIEIPPGTRKDTGLNKILTAAQENPGTIIRSNLLYHDFTFYSWPDVTYTLDMIEEAYDSSVANAEEAEAKKAAAAEASLRAERIETLRSEEAAILVKLPSCSFEEENLVPTADWLLEICELREKLSTEQAIIQHETYDTIERHFATLGITPNHIQTPNQENAISFLSDIAQTVLSGIAPSGGDVRTIRMFAIPQIEQWGETFGADAQALAQARASILKPVPFTPEQVNDAEYDPNVIPLAKDQYTVRDRETGERISLPTKDLGNLVGSSPKDRTNALAQVKEASKQNPNHIITATYNGLELKIDPTDTAHTADQLEANLFANAKKQIEALELPLLKALETLAFDNSNEDIHKISEFFDRWIALEISLREKNGRISKSTRETILSTFTENGYEATNETELTEDPNPQAEINTTLWGLRSGSTEDDLLTASEAAIQLQERFAMAA